MNSYTFHTYYNIGEDKMKNPPKGKNAFTVKVGEKGQFVIPKEARDMLDINPGDTILVLVDKKRGLAVPPKKQINKLLDTIFKNSFPEEEE